MAFDILTYDIQGNEDSFSGFSGGTVYSWYQTAKELKLCFMMEVLDTAYDEGIVLNVDKMKILQNECLILNDYLEESGVDRVVTDYDSGRVTRSNFGALDEFRDIIDKAIIKQGSIEMG